MSLPALLVAALLADATPLSVTAVPVPLEAAVPSRETAGALRFRGGLALTSPDDRFGGLSGLHVGPDGSWLAVTDEGCWVRGRLLHSAGRLIGVAGDRIGELHGPAGTELTEKRDQDAEELLELPSGERLVSFERRHRVLVYGPADTGFVAPRPLATPPELQQAPENAGIEAMAWLPEDDLLLLTEGLEVPGGVRGWLGGPARWQPFVMAVDDRLRPAAAASLSDDEVLVLLRGFTPVTGVVVQLRRLSRSQLGGASPVAGELVAELRGPLTVDNFESLAVRRGADGELLLYLLSDDNFNPLQRTLLLMFALVE